MSSEERRGNSRTNVNAEQSIPVVEEGLRVGKREDNRRGVRALLVVEEPVHEEVNRAKSMLKWNDGLHHAAQ